MQDGQDGPFRDLGGGGGGRFGDEGGFDGGRKEGGGMRRSFDKFDRRGSPSPPPPNLMNGMGEGMGVGGGGGTDNRTLYHDNASPGGGMMEMDSDGSPNIDMRSRHIFFAC